MKTGILGASLMIAASVSAGVVDDLQNSCRSAGAAAFSEARGLALWQTQGTEERTRAAYKIRKVPVPWLRRQARKRAQLDPDEAPEVAVEETRAARRR